MKGAGDKVCCTFTTYNVLGMVFGGLVVGVASWLAADKRSFFTQLQLLEVEEGQVVGEQFQNISVIDYGAFVLVAIGVAIMVQSLLGCTGTFMGCCGNRKARSCLIVYGVLVAIVIVLEIVAAVLVLHVYQEDVTGEARQFMLETIKTDYKLPSQGKFILCLLSLSAFSFLLPSLLFKPLPGYLILSDLQQVVDPGILD